MLAAALAGGALGAAGRAHAEPGGAVLVASPSVDPQLDAVAQGFTAWLELRLAAGGIETLPRERILGAAGATPVSNPTPSRLVELASEAGAGMVVFSSVRFTSGLVEIRLRALDTRSGQLAAVSRAESPLAVVGEAAEGAAGALLKGLGIDARPGPPPLVDELATSGRALQELERGRLYAAWREVDGKISTTTVAVRKRVVRNALEPRADAIDRARVLAAAGEVARGWALIERDVKRATADPKANVRLLLAAAEIELARSNPRDARRHVETLIEAGADDVSIQRTYARVLIEQRDDVRARSALEQAIRLDPDDGWSHEKLAGLESSSRKRRAELLLAAGRIEAARLDSHRAISLLERATRTEPSVAAEAWRSRGDLERALGRPAESLAAYRKVVEISGEDAKALGGIGDAELALGDKKSAEASYRKALAITPNDPDALQGLGIVHLETRRAKQAVPLLTRAAKIEPDNAERRRNLAQALRATGDLDGALEWLTRPAQNGMRRSSENLQMAAEIQTELGRHHEARDLLLEATRLEPFDPAIQERLARSYAAAGDDESAARARELTALLRDGDAAQEAAARRDSLSASEIAGPDFDDLIGSFASQLSNAGDRRVVRLEIRNGSSWRDRLHTWLHPRAPDVDSVSASLDAAIARSFALQPTPAVDNPVLSEQVDGLFEFERKTSLDADTIARVTQTFDANAVFLARFDWTPEDGDEAKGESGCSGRGRYDVEVRMLSGQHADLVSIFANRQCVEAGFTEHGVWNRRALGCYAAVALLLVFPLLRGWGKIGVTVKVPPKTKGFFAIRVSKSADDVPTSKSKAASSGRLKTSLRVFSRWERNMVGRDTLFRWIPARKRSYHVTVKGPLMDAAGEEIIGHFLETQKIRVARGRTTAITYDFQPKESAVEIEVRNGEKPVAGARIAVRGQRSLIRYARSGSAILPLGKGSHRILIGAGARVAEHTVNIDTLGRSFRLLAQLADENTLVFKDCEAAVEPMLVGDYLTAADALEAAGQVQQAHLVRATFHQQVGATDAAANELEAAGEFEEAAQLRAIGDDAAGSAALFEKAGDPAQAADAYRAAGQIADAARCYESAYDYHNALECYREIGDDEKALELLEKTGEFFEAGALASDRGDHDRALVDLQQVERRSSGYGDACKRIADILELRGDFDLAADKVEEAIQTAGGKASAALFERHAELLSKAGRPEQAIDAYQTVRRIEPQRRDVGERIAELQRQTTRRPEPAEQESRYEILEEVGRGAMGVVYKARDKNLGRVVALKRLPESLKNHPTAVTLFKREAQAAAALNHPNIVTLFDAGEENGTYFITMELLEGYPLNHILRKRGRLSVSDTLRIGIQVAAGLQYAKDRRIVHRDIKSGNLFFTSDRTVKIMDFGLAKTIEEVRKTSTMIGGTPNFMAPEQAAGGEVDHRADLYAFGVTLYQLLTGTVPFEDGDLAYHHRHTPAPDPRSRVESIPAPLAELILRMLAKSPDERPGEPAEVAREMQALLDAPGSGRPSGA